MDHSSLFIFSSRDSIPFIFNIIPTNDKNSAVNIDMKKLRLKFICIESMQFKTILPNGAINENPII